MQNRHDQLMEFQLRTHYATCVRVQDTYNERERTKVDLRARRARGEQVAFRRIQYMLMNIASSYYITGTRRRRSIVDEDANDGGQCHPAASLPASLRSPGLNQVNEQIGNQMS